jgi:hypothetical protein
MIHVVKLIQRRFPSVADRVIPTLLTLSASALAIGIGFMLFK